MSENLSYLPPEEKRRLAYIEGRPDLFETKVLKLKISRETEGDEHKNLLVVARDPGSANALVPVLKELSKDEGVYIMAVTDGRAEEILEKNFQTENITPEGNILEADGVMEVPEVVLMDLSSGEIGLDTYVSATFSEVPKVLVEDYYTTARGFIEKLKERNLPLPDKICVMDQGAKDIIVKGFPDLEDRIEVTGQPIFDKFAHEDTEKIAEEVKSKLGLKSSDKLISYMSTMDEPEKIMQMAETLKKNTNDFYFVFRRHPRDNVSYETYKKILTHAGIKVIDTHDFTTDEIGVASDVVLTTWSTEGLSGIYRRKPTVHIVDSNFRVSEGLELPLVPVKLGASVGINRVDKLAGILPELLNKESALNSSLSESMQQNYPVDGKNAERVANVVRQYLK